MGEGSAAVSEHIVDELGNRHPHGLFDVMMNGLQFLESWLIDLQFDIAMAAFQDVAEGKTDKIWAVRIVIYGANNDFRFRNTGSGRKVDDVSGAIPVKTRDGGEYNLVHGNLS